jgi:dephospho-CoA kinase
MAEERAALVLDADAFVHNILDTDPGAQRAVIDAFGDTVCGPGGTIDRAAVAAIVFTDKVALNQLEQILHPRVRSLVYKQIDRSSKKVVFIEAIKLLEGGLAAECDQIWVTRCPEATQVQRLMSIRQLDEETALMRVQAQSSQETKAAAADVIIDTGGTLANTEAQFEMAWQRLQRLIPAATIRASQATGLQGTMDNDQEPGQGEHEERTAGTRDQIRPPEPRNFGQFGPDISVRRAQPADIPIMVELIKQSTEHALLLDPDQLLIDLGERGYLIGQQGETITAIAGWNAENLVATIDCLYVYPPEAINVTGAAVVREIVMTANELICEVIITLLGEYTPAGTQQILVESGFSRVVPESVPLTWRAAIEESWRPDATMMLNVLRDTRQVRVRKMKEYDG